MCEREWWINVYPDAPEHRQIGVEHPTKAIADGALRNRRDCVDPEEAPAFRIHVRLKPEGAPKRYASEFERELWEADPEWCRHHARYLPLAVRSPAALMALMSGKAGCDHGV